MKKKEFNIHLARKTEHKDECESEAKWLVNAFNEDGTKCWQMLLELNLNALSEKQNTASEVKGYLPFLV